MWFTIGFSTACAVSLLLLPEWWLLLFAALSAGFALLLSAKNPGLFRKITAAILCGVAAGLFWISAYQHCFLSDIAALDKKQHILSITATDYSDMTARGSVRVYGNVEWEGKTYKTCAYLKNGVSLSPGDTITAPFLVTDTISDGWYDPANGVFLRAYQKEEGSVVREVNRSFLQIASLLSDRIENRIALYFTQEEFAFSKALLLGDTEDIDYSLDTQLKVSGIRHIVAVSGLHVSVLMGLLYFLTLKRPWITALIGIPILAVFAAMAGFSPSVTRACLMSALMVLGLCIDREYDGPTALAFSVLVMLLINPIAVASVSLQLSVSSVAGIFLFCRPIYEVFASRWKTDSKWMDKVRKWILSSVSVTLSAMFFTTPLCAVHFGSVSLIGVGTNLLTLWAVGFIFCGIIAVCAVSFFWHGAAVLLALPISWLIQYVLKCVEVLSRFPIAAVYTDSIYMVLWLVFCYCLLALFWAHKNRSASQLVLCAALTLMTALFFSWMEVPRTGMRMQVLDVGQGQSIVFQTEGRTFLVDCGGDSDEGTADVIVQNLLSQGIRRLDGIIITHQDRDHAGALPYLLTRLETDLLITPFTQEKMELPQIKGEIVFAQNDLKIPLESGCIRIFASGYWGDGNENSLCVLFERENCAILITGDRSSLGEKMLLKKVKLPKVDVLIAGHHGSEDSTSQELLEAVQPDIVIISAGKGNSYGHPHKNTLRRLESYGCKVYRTDLNGTLEFRR